MKAALENNRICQPKSSPELHPCHDSLLSPLSSNRLILERTPILAFFLFVKMTACFAVVFSKLCWLGPRGFPYLFNFPDLGLSGSNLCALCAQLVRAVFRGVGRSNQGCFPSSIPRLPFDCSWWASLTFLTAAWNREKVGKYLAPAAQLPSIRVSFRCHSRHSPYRTCRHDLGRLW